MISVLTMKGLGAVVAVAALSGCAGLYRTRSQDMTVPEHEHAAQVDLRKSEEASAAARSGGRGASYERYSAQRHRELADEHAAAAGARREEVAAVCAEVGPSRPLGTMAVASVDPIRENDVPRRLRNPRGYYPEWLKGARIALQVGEATARAAAARSVECEAARTAAGLEPADLASPFAVRSARAIVRAEDPGIVIEVRGDQGEARGDPPESDGARASRPAGRSLIALVDTPGVAADSASLCGRRLGSANHRAAVEIGRV